MKQIFVLFIVSTLHYSCIDSGCSDDSVGNILVENGATFKIVDKVSRQNLFWEGATYYNEDSLKLLNEDLTEKQVIRERGNDYKFIVYDIFDKSIDPLTSTLFCKKYFVYYKNDDIDSLKICYTTKDGKCGSIFNEFKVYCQQELIYDGTEDAKYYTFFSFEIPR